MPRKSGRAEDLNPVLAQYAQGLWEVMARPDQLPPTDQVWRIWLLLGGRGSGKTRSGAEWIRDQVWHRGKRHVALIAPTYQDAREVMLEGASGVMNIGFTSERPTFFPSRQRLTWPNGAIGHVFSAEDPDSLRGSQFDCAWADEFCTWAYPDDTLSNLRLALRLGDAPQLVITTTPKPTTSLRRLMKTPGLVTTRSRTHQNAAHLAPGFVADLEAAYKGTTLSRQELDGEIIDNPQGGLWSRELIENCKVYDHPKFDKVIIAVDPPACRDARGDACGIIIVGWTAPARAPSQKNASGRAKHDIPAKAYVLHDGTVRGLSTGTWVNTVLGRWRSWGVDYIVIEKNMGGDMVEDILKQREPDAVIRPVNASRGKRSRAEPVAALYEQGRVFHVADKNLHALEDELIYLGQMDGHKRGRPSPDRADALVWAIWDLLIRPRGEEPSLRGL